MKSMSKAKERELELAIKELNGTEEKPAKKVKIRKAPENNEVKVNVVPGHEQIIWSLRSLTDADFKEVVRAAKQYRKADKILEDLE